MRPAQIYLTEEIRYQRDLLLQLIPTHSCVFYSLPLVSPLSRQSVRCHFEGQRSDCVTSNIGIQAATLINQRLPRGSYGVNFPAWTASVERAP